MSPIDIQVKIFELHSELPVGEIAWVGGAARCAGGEDIVSYARYAIAYRAWRQASFCALFRPKPLRSKRF